MFISLKATRRTFMAGVSALAVNPSVTSAILFSGRASKIGLQVNPSFLGQGDYAFINHLKEASTWTRQLAHSPFPANSPVDPAELDVRGYPTVLANAFDFTYCVCKIPATSDRPNGYYLYCDANGATGGNPVTINIWGNDYNFSGGWSNSVLIAPTTSGPGTNVVVLIKKLGAGNTGGIGPQGMALVYADDKVAFDSGSVFQTKFKELAKNFLVFRFLDWMPSNESTQITWADRKPLASFSYAVDQFPSSAYAGLLQTADSTSYANSGTLPAFVLSDKARVIVAFPAAQTNFNATVVTLTKNSSNIGWTSHNLSVGQRVCFVSSALLPNPLQQTAYYVQATPDANTIRISLTSGGSAITPTGDVTGTNTGYAQSYLNISGTGAKPILNPGGLGRTTGAGFYGLAWTNCVYDQTLDGWVTISSPSGTARGINNGVPPELMVQFANETATHPWFPIPFMAADAAGSLPILPDYTSQLAAYCRDNLSLGLIPRFEGPNETWNSQFNQTQYGWVKESFRNGGVRFDSANWYGTCVSLIGQAVSAVYSADRSRYHVVCGFQTVQGNSFTTNSATDRLDASVYVAAGGSPAYNWATHLCCANYFLPGDYGTAGETTAATNWAAAAGDQPAQDVIIAAYLATCTALTGGLSETIPQQLLNYRGFANLASGYNTRHSLSIGLEAYEGGYSPDYIGATNSTVNTFRGASRYGATLPALETNNFINMINSGFLYPSVFCLSGGTGTGVVGDSIWPIYDPDIYSLPSTRWQAIAPL